MTWTTNFDDIVCDSITATTSTITTQTIQDLTATGNTTIGNAATDTTTLTWVVSIANKAVLSGSETIAAGWTTTALSLTVPVHNIDADAGWDIFTLANGVAWQIMVIFLKTATGVATITPATFLGWTSITLNAAWDSVMLIYVTTLWWTIIWGNSYAIV